jgi:hypothetical protein
LSQSIFLLLLFAVIPSQLLFHLQDYQLNGEAHRDRKKKQMSDEKHTLVSAGNLNEFGGGYADRLCGLMVRVPGYRSRGPGSISGATRFFLRSSGSGMGSTQPREDN